MSTPLLTTKLMTPPASHRLVTRSRLLRRLDESLRPDCLLTLVCAPAGYGKTSLVSSWLHKLRSGPTSPIQSAWLTLDPGDDDLARFLSYFVAALRQIRPGVGEAALTALQSSRPPASRMLATWLINDLAEITDPYVMVLDDYHTLEAQEVHDFMAFLVENQPVQMCLVIASRADPILPLARLRGRGQLTELRQEDLCFNLDETTVFVNDRMGLQLTADQLSILGSRTEGWAAGLQLAALSMRHTDDISGFIQTFSGGHVHIADYLTDEVLARQHEELKTFLLQTSILDRLSAPLCEAVTGQPQAKGTLEKLSEANLFVIPLDHEQEWYRYHILFADLLRKRLIQTQGEAVDELHRRASRWYQDQGYLNPAVEHALAGHDTLQAADLIAQLGESILMHSEAVTLLRWLEALPLDLKRNRPILLIYQGLGLILCSRPLEALKSELENLVEAAETHSVQGEFDTFQSLLAVMKGQTTEAIRLAEQALQRMAPERAFFRTLAVDTLGMAYTLLGDTEAAARAFERVAEVAEQSGNVMILLGALANLAGLQVLQGQLHAASGSYRRVLDLAERRLGRRAPMTGKALFGLGSIAREWNDLDRALQYYEEAIEMFKLSVEIGQSLAHLAIAMVKVHQGNWEAAQKKLEEARQLARSTTTTPLDDRLVEETQARLWVIQGKLEPAMDWLRSTGILERPIAETLAADDPRTSASLLVNQANYLILARIYLAMEQPEAALAILNPLLDILYTKKHMRRVIEVTALKALALQQQKDNDAAVRLLDQALALAEPEGFLRTFLDEGEPMAQLLYEIVARGEHPVYAGKVLAAMTEGAASPSTPAKNSEKKSNLIEPLSDRELEVLALIADGLSNKEIANRLMISLSTVKSHNSHIFGKLNTTSRTQAIALARSLRLIPPK